jgi:hypothetical protein
VFDLNVIARKAAGITMALGVSVRWVWVASAGGWVEDLTVFGCVEKHPGPPSYFKGPIIRTAGTMRPTGMYGMLFSGVKLETAGLFIRASIAFRRWFYIYGCDLDVQWEEVLALLGV